MTEPNQENQTPHPEERLDSWKEIAAYLKRDVSTVQRWEKRESLPVHRHVHNRLPSVYAYRPEIDTWWNNRRPRLEQEDRGRAHPIGQWRLGWAAAAMILAVALAFWGRDRLAALLTRGREGAARPSVTLRKQPAPEKHMFLGLPSPDARTIPYADSDTGDLALYDFATGDSRYLTHKGSWKASPDFAMFSSLSPEGAQVAYSWYNDDGDFVDLRLLSLEGSTPRVLYRDREIEHIQLAEWSRDGDAFLALFSRKGRSQLVAIHPEAGSVSVLRSFGRITPRGMSFSPDGRYAVYDLPRGDEVSERDIYLIRADGSGETPLVEHPKNDLYPLWSPDGGRVVFMSDRTDTLSLWSIRVEEGEPRGEPEPVHKDLGRASPLAITRDGAFYFQLQTGMVNVYMAKLDPRTGAVIVKPTPAADEFFGSNLSPGWSPDGRFLAYTSRRGHLQGEKGSVSLIVRSMESGQERSLTPELTFLMQPLWSPDSRSIAVKGGDGKGNWGLHEIDVGTGQVRRTLFAGNFFAASRSRDGKRVLYNTNRRIVRRDLESGKEQELYRVTEPSAVQFMDLSPDGRWLALTRSRGNGDRALLLMRVEGGPVREVLAGKEPFQALCWTADGKALLFTRGDYGPGVRRVYRIGVEGGEPVALDLAMEGLRELRASPDGQRVAFTAGWPTLELWVMEDFLPEGSPVSRASR